MKRSSLLLSAVFLLHAFASAQKDYLADSLKKGLSLAHTDAEKVFLLDELALYYSGLDNDLAADYGAKAMATAELSRDRKLIVRAYLRDGGRWLTMASLANIELALQSYQHAEKMAKDNGLDEELGYVYTSLSRVYRAKGEHDKAINYNNQALSIASGSNSDSLKVVAYNSMGNTYRMRNEKLLAFRSYLEALNVAEVSKKDALLKLAYATLSECYAGIEDYDKAIDHSLKVMAIDRKNNDRYSLLDDYNSVGRLFSAKKQIDIALSMYESAIALADSLRYHSYKINSYLNIANMYFSNHQVVKGMQYLNAHQQVLDFFKNAGLGFYLDEGYGSIYTALGKLDSAYYFLKKSEPAIEQKSNYFVKYNFYEQFGTFYKAKGDLANAILYYLKAKKIGETVKDISLLESCAKNLDTLYDRSGDYRMAYKYNSEYNIYKDSIKTLAKETDMLKLEVDNDNRRRERLAKEEEENTARKHNIQYMGLTAGLAGLFVALVMMGFFVVSPRTIRALGFFSFIFLFEFIILLADKQIHEWTHGEPWKILLIKIFLAAVLLPLHHWLEHKVIHYLTSRRKISTSGMPFLGKVFKKKSALPPEAS